MTIRVEIQYNLDVSDGFGSESSLYRRKVVDSSDFWRIYRNPLCIVVRNKILGNLYVIRYKEVKVRRFCIKVSLFLINSVK